MSEFNEATSEIEIAAVVQAAAAHFDAVLDDRDRKAVNEDPLGDLPLALCKALRTASAEDHRAIIIDARYRATDEVLAARENGEDVDDVTGEGLEASLDGLTVFK